ncbi:MAG: hypothetical protein GY845_24115 [Planctomycetes bacterium]|nr:hypothetical protein [Planctomycetota bacterium]
MEEKKSIPVSLTVVAILFILGGIYAVIDIIVAIAHSRISINFNVLGLFIGPGLLALRPGWRKYALFFTWIAIIGIPIIALLIITVRGPLDFKIFGQVVGHTTKGFGLLIVGIIYAVALWQYHVLTRPDVKELFQI